MECREVLNDITKEKTKTDCSECLSLEKEFEKNPGGKSIRSKGLIIAGITGGVAIALSGICLPFVTPALRRICLPYVPATDAQIQNVVRALQHRRKGTSLVDIGSGDGRIVFECAKLGYNATGIELNPWLVLYSKFKNLAIGSSLPGKASFIRRDLWKADLRQYDNIVVFGVEEMMGELEFKLIKEVKKDSQTIACRFPLPNLTPDQEIGEGIDTVWTYLRKKKPI
ncbi:ATP synthase subunit C lysine N-methyltransferase [Lepeophtheirus salmonis]|uniref:ATP synthase subunit C lysine N-methyltransferase n=1 Tax=Lepeophtheirus salmonis TaxID=72036 RepID=UPI001AE4790D|nr:ATP synthase subunit C lysine N-methyltransferase-like [Lepeophtheirus salmonis]